jgi:hypothetical protein
MKSMADILAGIPRPASHPHRAVILVTDQPRSHGCVADRCSTTGGIFWPDDGEILAEPIQEAVLDIPGATKISIRNIEQCASSRIHWNFDL